MNESLKEKLLFLLEENLFSAIIVIIMLLSIFYNDIMVLWISIIAYMAQCLLKKHFLGKKKKKENIKKDGKVINFDSIEKKIK